MNRFLALLVLGILTVPPLVAGPVRISFKDTTVVRGSTLYIPVRVDSSLTALGVYSYQVEISYTASSSIIDTAVATGSMTASWPAPIYHNSPGHISISAAGITPLSGTGTLVFIRLKVPLVLAGGGTSLTLNSVMFNEGSPATTLRSGFITISNPPAITVYPDNAVLPVGATLQFAASGAIAPVSWSTTSPAATISASGMLTAVTAGFCKVVAVDNNGTRDTSSDVEIRACKVSVRDTTYRQGQMFLLPVYISDLSAVNILSGTFTLSYNPLILTALGISTPGTLVASNASPTADINSGGSISVAFASTTRLNGVGQQILVYIQFQVTPTAPYGSALALSNILFNENILATNQNATFNPISTSSLFVSPGTATLVAGDSLQFTVSGGAIGPVVWSVSKPSLATISPTGKLKALASGTLTVTATDSLSNTGKSGIITLYDIKLQLPTITSSRGFIVEQTFLIDGFPAGILSAQFLVNFNATYLRPISVSNLASLTSSWLVAVDTSTPGALRIAAAGFQPITTAGVLLKVRFKIADNTPNTSFPLTLTNTMLNEGNPSPLITNGNIVVSSIAVTQSFLNGWNMISVPLDMPDMRKTFLYPAATTKAYAYNGAYTTPDTLQNRLGYWLKFVGAQSTGLAGLPRTRDTINVRANGWNLIGSVAYPVPKTAIVQTPAANTISPYYTYVSGTGYKQVDTIKPGVGYWIKTQNVGKLVLDIANIVPGNIPGNIDKTAENPASAQLNELRFAQLLESGTTGEPAKLYFGERATEPSGSETYELPPVPPAGTFDVRFGSDTYVGRISSDANARLPIAIQSEGLPVTVSWTIGSPSKKPYELIERRDGIVVGRHPLVAEGSCTISDPANTALSIEAATLPTAFGLRQNYPNPFNPSTEISYDVAEAGYVTMNVYDMLGREVATLIGGYLGAGEYRVSWDASGFTSGVYYCRLTAGTRSSTLKMLLVR